MAYDLQEQESIDQLKAWWEKWGTPITAVVCAGCLAFAGWNTLSDRALQVLDAYVAQGGTLVMGLPHASTRTDREYSAYTLADVHPQIRGRLSGQADHPGGAVRAESAAGSALSAAPVFPAGFPRARFRRSRRRCP